MVCSAGDKKVCVMADTSSAGVALTMTRGIGGKQGSPLEQVGAGGSQVGGIEVGGGSAENGQRGRWF
jgi:hypothetical protein